MIETKGTTGAEKATIRKYERLTGLDLLWLSESLLLIGFLDNKPVINARGKTLKDAALRFREHNLRRIRDIKMLEQGGKCGDCGGRQLQLHHNEHRSQGGDDRPENLELICVDCHAKKHDPNAGFRVVSR
jgi:hypothetical protein